MELTPEEKQRIQLEEEERHKAQSKIKGKETAQGCMGCLVLIIVIVIISALVGSCGDNKKEPENIRLTVFLWSEIEVKNNLKSPTTAKFPLDYENMVSDMGNNNFKVSSYVDSQNGFGAIIRTYYTCDVQYISKENCLVSNLQFSN